MANYKNKTKDEIIKAEKRKLNGIYKKLDKETRKAVDPLIDQAAFMAASLHELKEIINEKGFTEQYQNGANQKGVKKCSEVEIYNAMIKNYMSVIKQLTDLLPKEPSKISVEVKDEFEEFVQSRDD